MDLTYITNRHKTLQLAYQLTNLVGWAYADMQEERNSLWINSMHNYYQNLWKKRKHCYITNNNIYFDHTVGQKFGTKVPINLKHYLVDRDNKDHYETIMRHNSSDLYN